MKKLAACAFSRSAILGLATAKSGLVRRNSPWVPGYNPEKFGTHSRRFGGRTHATAECSARSGPQAARRRTGLAS
jgi:hypothetical protein